MAELKCFRCGAPLTRQDVCLQCGEDMRLYKKILYNADHLYNLGLERAQSRDLSGARNYLRECLQLNKNHITARNLLGLVYYEMGEPALALKEWVISTSLQPEDNVANKYLKNTEKNMHSINGSVTRYNMAVTYLRNGSRDLAVVQLKQLMTRSYQLLKAKQLMALLYMQDEHFGRAQKILKECQKIDKGNPVTKRYIKALDEHKKQSQSSSYRQAVSEVVSAQDGDVIIPHNTREYGSYFLYVLYIIIGLIIGAGLVYYIVVPTVRKKEQNKNQENIKQYEWVLSEWQNDLVNAQAESDRLRDRADELKEIIASYESEDGGLTYDVFLPMLKAYADYDPKQIEIEFDKLDADSDNEEYKRIYELIKADVLKNLGDRAYYCATKYLDQADYQKALELFEYAAKKKGYDTRIVYHLGLCNQMLNKNGWAVYYYQYAIVTYPNEPFTENSKARLASLLDKDPELEVPEIQPGEMGSGLEQDDN